MPVNSMDYSGKDTVLDVVREPALVLHVIGQHVGDDDTDGQQQERALQQRKVLFFQRILKQLAEAE